MDVAPWDPLQSHVVQVENVVASPILLAPNVQLVSQDFMDFPTAKVNIEIFKTQFF